MIFWIVQTGEPLHCDGGVVRPMRAMNLANTLLAKGHEVVIWSSNFFHQEKRYRASRYSCIEISDRLTIRLVPSPGYKRNIGLGRLIDHAIFAKNLSFFLKKIDFEMPSAIVVGYPPIEAAYVTIRWAQRRNIPTVIDVKDQWPSLFLDPFPKWLRPFVNLLLAPYFLMGKWAFRNATALSSMSDPYVKWAINFSGRKSKRNMVAPLTVDLPAVQPELLIQAREWWQYIGLNLGSRRRFIFVGSFMSVFDFKPIRNVAKRFLDDGIECEFVLCGDGGSAAEIKELMKGLPNVIFPGWVDYPKIKVLAGSCSGALIPYRNIDNFTLNVPNKVVDALALGMPILTTLQGEVARLASEEGVGFVCDASEPQQLYRACLSLLSDVGTYERMSKRAIELYRKKFDFSTIYIGFSDELESIARSGQSA